MFSYLLHVSLFIDILIVGILLFGANKFYSDYKASKNKKYLYLSAIFTTYLITIFAAFASKIVFILNLGIDYAIEIEKIGLYGLIVNSIFVWLFYNNLKNKKLIFSYVIVCGVALILFLYILISPIQIIYRDNTINPIIENAYVIPVKIYWLFLWTALLIYYFVNRKEQEKDEFSSLNNFIGFSVILIILSNISSYLYTNKAQVLYLLLSWILNYFGWINFLLGQAVMKEKMKLKNPWHYFRTKFIYKLVSIFVILIFISVEGVALLTLQLSQNSILDAKINSFQENAEALNSKIDNYLHQQLRKMSNFSRQISFNNTGTDKRNIDKFLKENTEYNHISIYTPAGTLMMRQTTPLYKEYNNESKLLKGVIKKIKLNQEYLKLIYDGIDSIFILGVGIKERGVLKGFVCSSLNFDGIFDMVRNIRIGKLGYLFILTKNGLLVHPDPKRVEIKEKYEGQKFFNRIFDKEKNGGIFSDEIGKKMLGASILNKEYEWVIVSEQPLEESYEALSKAEANSILFVIIASLLTLIVGIFLARSIEKPVKEMIQGTDIISKGNLSHQIKIKNIDELGQLAEAFNKMTRDLNDAQKKLLEAEKIKLVSQMSISLNHEINNPMQSILFIAQSQSHLLKKIEQKSEDEKKEEMEKMMKRMVEFSSILESQTKKIKDIIYSLRQLREVETVEYLPGAPMLKLAKHTGFASGELSEEKNQDKNS